MMEKIATIEKIVIEKIATIEIIVFCEKVCKVQQSTKI